MKILLLQDHLRSGGTERQTVLLANAFVAAGHAVRLVTLRPGGPLASSVHPGVERVALQPFDTGLDWFAPGLRRTAAAFAPDVILCMGRIANCYAGGLHAHLPRCAVVATMRTGKVLPAKFRASLRTVRHVVANSAEARDFLQQEHGVPAARLSVIHNSLVFPATSAGAALRDSTRAAQGAGPGTTVLACVAMFRREKNQQELVEIAAGLPAGLDWHLWLAGEGPELASCRALAARRGVASRVKFPGWLADPAPVYAAADIAVHASWSESLSNFLIEAQARGLPAVAYQAQGIAECFRPGETGWVIPRDDRDAFREAVVRLAGETPARRQDRAARAAAFARDRFDPARQVRAYLDLFGQLTGPSGLS
jgi:glycosyltransferase involved in cell wall biosynthesis